MNNFEWLNTISPIAPKQWHNERVIRPWEIEHYNFYDNIKRYSTKIHPKDIKGIEYAYAYNCSNDITWLDLLNQLKRFKHIRANKSTFDELVEHSHNELC